MVNYAEKVISPELKMFMEKAVEKYGNEEQKKESNKVADIMYQMLEKRRYISKNHHEIHVDILLVSALMHNLFFDPNDYTTLYKARFELDKLAEECEVRESMADLIFDTIESQLGEDPRVPAGSRPKPNTPQELFSNAVWFAKEYKEAV